MNIAALNISRLLHRKRDGKHEAENATASYHQPQTVDELTQRNIETIIQLDAATRANRNLSERVSDKITKYCGSMTFIWSHVAFFGAWIVWNKLPMLSGYHFDHSPFPRLSFIVGIEAIFLVSFLLMSQNQETQLEERRSHLALQIALLTEQENTKMLTMLNEIGKRLGADMGGDPELRVLEKATRPEELVEQIEQTIKQTEEQNNEQSDAQETLEKKIRASA